MPGKNHPRGKNPFKILFLSIVFFETLHPRQKPKPPLRSKSSSQIIDLSSSKFNYVVASSVKKLPTSTKLLTLWSPKIEHKTKRERSVEFWFFFSSLDSTQLTLPSPPPVSHFFRLQERSNLLETRYSKWIRLASIYRLQGMSNWCP